jgi:hypothetical protein
LVTEASWRDVEQTAYFHIRALNMSSSPNRNASNGVLFFHRYQDGANLYYAGIRVDGAAVIKKKIAGTYYTMAYRSGVYPGAAYDASRNPNRIPTDRWIGLRTVIEGHTSPVTIRLEMDDPSFGDGWIPIVEAEDSGQYGGAPMTAGGHAGIRTDFMDVEFQGYDAIDVSTSATPSPSPPPATPTPTFTARPTATPTPPNMATPTASTSEITVSPTFQAFGASGGSASAEVKCAGFCQWDAKSNATWLTITSGSSGNQSGTIRYSVSKITAEQSRSTTIAVAGQTISVSQSKSRK